MDYETHRNPTTYARFLDLGLVEIWIERTEKARGRRWLDGDVASPHDVTVFAGLWSVTISHTTVRLRQWAGRLMGRYAR